MISRNRAHIKKNFNFMSYLPMPRKDSVLRIQPKVSWLRDLLAHLPAPLYGAVVVNIRAFFNPSQLRDSGRFSLPFP